VSLVQEILLRPFTEADIPAAKALSSSFGWPHRAEDWVFASHLGFGIAAEDVGGIIGTAMAWPYGSDSAALGLVTVASDRQGRGIGRRLMQALLHALGDRTVILHATQAGLALYESLGFARTHMVRQHQGVVPDLSPDEPGGGPALRALTQSDRPVVHALDRAATGLDRQALIDAILRQGAGVLATGSGASGFALVRRFGHGDVIGPVVAPDVHAARRMIRTLLAPRVGRFVRVDVPEAGSLGDWLLAQGLADAGPVACMVRGAAPRGIDGSCTYAVAGQMFG
jgi:predicted N-acetyltransferase YhbS